MRSLYNILNESILDDDIEHRVENQMNGLRIWNDIVSSRSFKEFNKKILSAIGFGSMKEVTKFRDTASDNIYVGIDVSYPKKDIEDQKIQLYFFRGNSNPISIGFYENFSRFGTFGGPKNTQGKDCIRVVLEQHDTLRGWCMKAGKRGNSSMSHVVLYELPTKLYWFYEILEKNTGKEFNVKK